MGSSPEWRHRPEIDVGQHWAYRASGHGDLVEVAVLRLGVRRPPRVQVRWVSDDYEGLTDWVSPARLKALWADVDAFKDWEIRWNALVDATPDPESTEHHAVSVVLHEAFPRSVLNLGSNATAGVTFIRDEAAAAQFLGVEPRWFARDALAIREDDFLAVSWPTTLQIAQLAASIESERILRRVAREERQARYEAVHGIYPDRRDPNWYIEPADAAADDMATWEPVRSLLRQWCGANPVSRDEELQALRDQVARLDALATVSLDRLATSGHRREANRLAREHGHDIPVVPKRVRRAARSGARLNASELAERRAEDWRKRHVAPSARRPPIDRKPSSEPPTLPYYGPWGISPPVGDDAAGEQAALDRTSAARKRRPGRRYEPVDGVASLDDPKDT